MPESSSDIYRPITPILDEARKFADENKSAGLAVILEGLDHQPDWRLSLARTPLGVTGVSVILSDGRWFLDAKDTFASFALADIVGQANRAKVLCASRFARECVRGPLLDRHRISSEGQSILMETDFLPFEGTGSWATHDDLPALAEFWIRTIQDLPSPPWKSLVSFREVAIARINDRIAEVVISSGSPSKSISLRLYASPDADRETSRSLICFAAKQVIAAGGKVFAWIEEEDSQALELYQSLGFTTREHYYRATLGP